MPKFQSIAHVVSILNLKADALDLEAVRREVRHRLTLVHPDTTSGRFQTAQQKSSYHELLAAHEYLNLLDYAALVTQPEAFPAPVTPESPPLPPSNPESLAITSSHRLLRRGYFLPKVTSAILASLLALMIPFLSTFESHPLFRGIRNALVTRELDSHAYQAIESISEIVHQLLVVKAKLEIATEILPEQISEHSNDLEAELKRRVRERVPHDLEGTTSCTLSAALMGVRPIRFELLNVTSTWDHPQLCFADPLLKSVDFSAVLALATDLASHLEQLSKSPPPKVRMSGERPRFGHDPFEWDPGPLLTQLAGDATSLAHALSEKRVNSEARASEKMTEAIVFLLVVCAFGFLLVWIRERSDEAWLEHLSTELGVVTAFDLLSHQYATPERHAQRFSLGEFYSAIAIKPTPPYLRMLFGGSVSTSAISPVAGLLLRRLEERGCITRAVRLGPEIWYDITTDLSKNEAGVSIGNRLTGALGNVVKNRTFRRVAVVGLAVGSWFEGCVVYPDGHAFRVDSQLEWFMNCNPITGVMVPVCAVGAWVVFEWKSRRRGSM